MRGTTVSLLSLLSSLYSTDTYLSVASVKGHRTPAIIVVKCGTSLESDEKKPGNRGKRDSQMILMNFFSRVTYNDRMCPLDYDLFRKVQSLMGVTPDFFEVCLMVRPLPSLIGTPSLTTPSRWMLIPRSTPSRSDTSSGRCRTTT